MKEIRIFSNLDKLQLSQEVNDFIFNNKMHNKNVLCFPMRKPVGELKRERGGRPHTGRCCKYRDSGRVGGSRSLGKPEKAAAAIV